MKIEFHGDSTQRGSIYWAPDTTYAKYAPCPMTSILHGVETVNLGVGGSTLKDALTGTIYPGGLNFADHIALSDADVIVTNWGINDAFLSDITSASHIARYQQIASICAAANKKLVIVTPNPVNNHRNWVVTNLANACKTVPCDKVVDINGAVQTWYPQWSAHMDSSTVHPNAIMYTWIGTIVAEALAEFIPDTPDHC